MQAHWSDARDYEHPVRADFADGTTSFTTVEHAADLADFIDRHDGIVAMLDGTSVRTHLGTVLTFVKDGSDAMA